VFLLRIWIKEAYNRFPLVLVLGIDGLCEHNGGRHVIGVPAMGCAFWQREPGSDDD